MIRESAVEMMATVPVERINLEYIKTVFMGLRKLLDVCETYLPFKKEDWYIQPITGSMQRLYSFTPDTKGQWQQELPAMLYDCEAVSVLMWSENDKWILPWGRFFDIHMAIDRFNHYKEREIRISVPRSLWNCIDTQAVIAAFQDVCCMLHVTYAAVDGRGPCPSGLNTAPFMEFAEHPNRACYETTLPAICWGQFVPLRRIHGQGEPQALIQSAPGCRSTLLQRDGETFAWLQIEDDIWKPKMRKRKALREHFKESFPKLDLRRIAEGEAHNTIGPWRYMIEWMPLLDEERAQIDALVQKIEQAKSAAATTESS